MKIDSQYKAILFTLGLVSIIEVLQITLLSNYGWSIFTLAPFLIGFLPPYLCRKHVRFSFWQSQGISFLTMLLALFAMLIFAIEGLICIFMALPLILSLAFIGSWIAYSIQKKYWNKPNNIIVSLILISMVSMGFDFIPFSSVSKPVSTEIIVNASIEKAWESVVTFDNIPEPTDWIFKTGIAYPTHATIEGTGVGAIRKCNFTTGTFVEPITTWNQPSLLQFDVSEQPIPMDEFNPFWDIHPTHLDGYFKSERGEFRLQKLNDNQTLIIGTTWYTVDFSPTSYWESWTEAILHKIHLRVLNHIKTVTEN